MSVGDWLGLLGIAIAIWQIVRAGRIAENARRAAVETAAKINAYSVLVVVPELSRIEGDLERAATGQEPDVALRALRDWRDMASDLKGLLGDSLPNNDALRIALESSVNQATTAKAALVRDPSDVVKSTRQVRKSVETACISARTYAGQIRVRDSAQEEVPMPFAKALARIRKNKNG